MKRLLTCLCLAAGLALAARPSFAQAPAADETAGMKPFQMRWNTGDEGILTDVSFLNAKPAGKDGFITIRDGHFAKPGGERFRIWGVNFTFNSMMPPKEDAPALARHLARFGINCIRMHHLDHPAPRGILVAGRDTTNQLDPEMMDRMDYFINELKKQGIYVDINLNVAHAWKAGDGVRDADKLGYGKGATYYDPRLIELQKEFARALLGHKNPYTGTEYRNEPAVALVEIVNENSLVEAWLTGRLVGNDVDKGNNPTWRVIPVSYDRELTEQYNAWLKSKCSPEELAKLRQEAGVAEGAAVPRLAPREFAKAGKLRFQTEAEFYIETENRFFEAMEKTIKDELGVKVPVIGNSIHSKGTPAQTQLLALGKLDAVDAHYYWNHPSKKRTADGRSTDTYINKPMVNAPAQSNIVTMSRAAVAGKPIITSEVNTPFPCDDYAADFPILTAYAAFQDWDGIFWFCYESNDTTRWDRMPPGNFNIRQDPVKMSQLAAGALLFLRGDVAPAKETFVRDYSREECKEALRLGWKAAPAFTPGYPDLLALAHGTRIGALDKKLEQPYPAVPKNNVKSDTGELEWRVSESGQGVVTLDAARAQGLIGFVKGSGTRTRNMTAEVGTDYCALTLTSLGQAPIEQAERLLLTAGGRVSLTGFEWNADRTMIANWGKLPLLIEPVAGTITLTGLKGVASVEAVALDGAGRPLGQAIAGEKTSADWKIKIGESATPWYCITVKR